jgi:hypothetical protein
MTVGMTIRRMPAKRRDSLLMVISNPSRVRKHDETSREIFVTTVRGNVGGAQAPGADSIFVRNQCNCTPPWPCMTALGQKRR